MRTSLSVIEVIKGVDIGIRIETDSKMSEFLKFETEIVSVLGVTETNFIGFVIRNKARR